MIEERFINSGELERGVFDPFYGQYLEDRIRSKILQSTTETPVPQDAEIEFSIYDEDNTLRYWDRFEDYRVEDEKFSLDVLSDIQESEIPNGSGYRLRYGFFKEELGSFGGNQRLFVQSFSDDRTEARVKPLPGRSNPFLQDFFDFFSNQNTEPLKLAANFGDNQYYRILDWSPIAETDRNGKVVITSGTPEYKEAAIIRFESELPDGVSVGDEFWIDREVSRPYFDKFEIFRAAEPEPANELAPPNFNVDFEKPKAESTFENLDDITDMGQIVDEGFQTSETFIESRFDSSIDLNVDFTDFENFIHFSSAEERIRNFRFKIRQLQQFVEDINGLQQSAAGQVETITRQMESLIGSFDRYERWLFRSDNDRAYPKKDNGSLFMADSREAREWFNEIIDDARRFDDRNESALRKQVPEFVKQNPDNEEFVLFVDLVAHWFDLNWLYIDHMEYFTDSKESAFEPESLSADLSRVVAESMGVETFNGFEAESFFDKIFDSENIEEIFDSKPVEQSTTPEVKEIENTGINRVDLSRFQAQQQVWRRLLSNLVQYYKSKGTENSIRMLGNIFGVPTGSLVVREYGGAPEDTDANEVLEDTTHYASFVSSQQISFPWQTGGQITNQPSSFDEVFDIFEEYPKAAEFRFRTEYQGGVPLKVFELTNVLEVRVERTGLEGNMGKFIMQIQEADGTVVEVETGEYPIFNGEWISVLLQVRESGPYIDLFVQERSPVGNIGQFDQVSANVQLQTISNFFTAPNLLFGGNEQSNRFETGVSFIGDLDQINIWQRTISDRRYNLHTLAPRRIDVDNEILATGDTNFDLEQNFLRRNLIYRNDFRTDQNLGQNPILQNESEKEETESLQAQAFGYGSFDGTTKYDRRNFFSPVQVGATSFFSTKIRIEDTEVSAPLEAGESVEQRPQNLISKDSKRLGIFFSPYTSANREIFSEIGVEEINDLLGNPRDQHRSKYYSLEGANRMYWNKYETPVNIQEYVRYIDKFYNAIFDHVRNSVPARVTLIDGIVIEPTILERDRESIPTGESEQKTQNATFDVPTVVTASFVQSSQKNLEVKTRGASDIKETSAVVNGELTQYSGFEDDGSKFVSNDAENLFEYREQGKNKYTNTIHAAYLSSPKNFDAKITNLIPSQTYEYRAVSKADGQTDVGSKKTFSTIGLEVKTNEATSIGRREATLNGEVTVYDNISDSTEAFFEWKEQEADKFNKLSTSSVSSEETFSKELNDLSPNVNYEYRAVVKRSGLRKEGDLKNFETEVAQLFSQFNIGTAGQSQNFNNNVYVAVSSVSDLTKNSIKKLDRSNGNEVWSFGDFFGKQVHSVSVDKFGQTYVTQADGTFGKAYKVRRDGSESVWQYDRNADIRWVQTDKNFNVYFGDFSNRISKVDNNGGLIWETEFIGGSFEDVSDIAVDSNGFSYMLISNKTDGESALYKFDPEGSTIYEYSLSNTSSQMAVDQTKSIYVAKQNEIVRLTQNNSGNGISQQDTLFTFDPTDFGATVNSLSVDAEGNSYVGFYDGTVKKINENGNEVWSQDSHGDRVTGTAVDLEENVYSCSEDGTAKKYDSDGNVQWTYNVDAEIESITVDPGETNISQGLIS